MIVQNIIGRGEVNYISDSQNQLRDEYFIHQNGLHDQQIKLMNSTSIDLITTNLNVLIKKNAILLLASIPITAL